MPIIVVHTPDGSPNFEFELTDEKLEIWQAIADARGQTLSESFEQIIHEFMESHPIIAQTRTPQ